MSQTTTPPNAPEVDVLAVLNLHCDCDSSEIAAGHYRAGLLCEKSAAVAALLTREAALVARNAELDKLLAESMRQLRREVAGNTELAMEKDALSAENKALRDDAERWREIERRFDRTKTSEAERVLYDLRLPNEDPCKPLAEIIDSARTPAKENLA